MTLMTLVFWFAAAIVLVFFINLSPGFMPSSWMVMAFFYIKFGLPLVPLALTGAIVSGFGRYFLAKGSDWTTRTFFKQKEQDLRKLGAYIERKHAWITAFVFGYAMLPLPTNNLF